MPKTEPEFCRFELPRMGLSAEASAAWVQSCVDLLATGQLSVDAFKALMTASSKNATAIKLDREANEMNELRELLALAERQRAEADEREKKIQQGRAAH